jgi:IS605 OrfB family transposase
MLKGLKYRISPTNSQKELIAKHIGSSRFVYNLALETKNSAYLGSKHNFSPFDLIKQLPELKKECEWLKEVNSQSLQQSIQNMDIAFKKFFKGAGFPKFKSKHKGRQSFSVPQNVIVENNLLIIPKFKEGIDFLHKTSTKLIRENQTICLETLAVSNMVKNHNLAQAITDVSWSTFVTMLEYKADWYGKNILRIGRFAPSSKTCGNCGSINKELQLKIFQEIERIRLDSNVIFKDTQEYKLIVNDKIIFIKFIHN